MNIIWDYHRLNQSLITHSHIIKKLSPEVVKYTFNDKEIELYYDIVADKYIVKDFVGGDENIIGGNEHVEKKIIVL